MVGTLSGNSEASPHEKSCDASLGRDTWRRSYEKRGRLETRNEGVLSRVELSDAYESSGGGPVAEDLISKEEPFVEVKIGQFRGSSLLLKHTNKVITLP